MTTQFPVAAPLTLTRQVAILILAGAAAVASGAAALAAFAGFGGWFMIGTLVCYVLASAVILVQVGRHHPFASFGPANVVTFGRLILTCFSAGLAAQTGFARELLSPAPAWIFTGVALAALLLDGIDGAIARRSGQISRFGARFDMEVDALQILLLSIIAVTLGKAGAWMLL